MEEDSKVIPVPIVYYAMNEEELQIVIPILESYNISLEDTYLPDYFYKNNQEIDHSRDDDDEEYEYHEA